MIDDIPAVRGQLSDHWEKIAIDLVNRGFGPQAVFDTLFTVALAGQVEMQGRDATALKLLRIAELLSQPAGAAATPEGSPGAAGASPVTRS